MFDPDPFHPNVFLESRGFLIWFPQIYQTFIRMIHMPEVLTIMFSAGNFGRAYDESLADFFLGSMGYLTFGHLIHLIIQRVCLLTAGLAKHTLPTGALADASIASDGFSRKMDGTDRSFFRNENDGSSLCLLRRDFLSSFICVGPFWAWIIRRSYVVFGIATWNRNHCHARPWHPEFDDHP